MVLYAGLLMRICVLPSLVADEEDQFYLSKTKITQRGRQVDVFEGI